MEKLVAQAIRLTDLADYQKGSVVSRTIIDKKMGTVTFFAFDEGQGLSEHTVPFDALVYLLEGKAEIVISGKLIYLKEGDMIIMPANQPHALRAVKNFKMILTMIRSCYNLMLIFMPNRSVSGSAFTLRPNSPSGNFIYSQNVIEHFKPPLEDKFIYRHL